MGGGVEANIGRTRVSQQEVEVDPGVNKNSRLLPPLDGRLHICLTVGAQGQTTAANYRQTARKEKKKPQVFFIPFFSRSSFSQTLVKDIQR